MDSPPPIVLFHYTFSPYALRVVWYMNLRGIPYSQCLQPATMPRPDLARLGIKHRRIPLLAIGRSVYADTRLIISTLETLFPHHPPLAPAVTPEHKALHMLLQRFTIDSGVFAVAAALLPPDLPMLRSAQWWADRASFFPGGMASHRDLQRGRPAALAEMRGAMRLLEDSVLSDGRDWVLGGPGPSVADVDAVWPFCWITSVPGALPAEHFSAAQFPRVYAWIGRFKGAVAAARQSVGKPETISGEEAYDRITRAPFLVEAQKTVGDGLSELEIGDVVHLRPTDYGTKHVDSGRLVLLDENEVAIEVQTQGKDDHGVIPTIHLHAPRHGFAVYKSTVQARL